MHKLTGAEVIDLDAGGAINARVTVQQIADFVRAQMAAEAEEPKAEPAKAEPKDE